jgi:di/tricarboxylate transporter
MDSKRKLAILKLTGLAALLSSFINNVGALALLMPVALQTAERVKVAPARVLLPVAFGASLGGMTTLIGTPPNLIVSSFRAGDGYAMFDFTPVGLTVAVIGVLFIGLVGWRLVPPRERQGADTFETGAYLTEARIEPGTRVAGSTLRNLGPLLERIGHQNNLLVMGPGGLRFGDYWRLGLPLELLIVAIATPALLVFWPL